jgi:cytidine deaminase
MNEIANIFLIAKAASIIRPRQTGDHQMGDVGCALVTDRGTLFEGVCIDTRSSLGVCAEHSAISAMVTAGEYRIRKIVAVWKEDAHTYVLAPCGRCREFIYQVHNDNIDTEVILDRTRVVTLAQLLPYHDWFHRLQE